MDAHPDAGGAQVRVQAALDNAKQVLLLRPAMRSYALNITTSTQSTNSFPYLHPNLHRLDSA